MASEARGLASIWAERGAITRAPQIDDWISIDQEGEVTVTSGKVELGTGVRTALAQIVAEELELSPANITMVMGDTRRTPNEEYTAGSKTIQFGGYGLRMAAAAARRELLTLAAKELGTDVERLTLREGAVVVAADPSRRVGYGALIGGRRFNREIGEPTPKGPGTYTTVGSSVERQELPGKFTGQASFIQDLRLPGMLHARVVRPRRPGEHLEALGEIDEPGVRVVTIRDFVAVVAEREETAIRASHALEARWTGGDPLPAITGLRELESGRVVGVDRGEVDRSLSGGPMVVEATYLQPYQAHASIGPSCAVADFREGSLLVYCSSQGVYPLRGAIAELLELPEERVRVVHREGSGCYGHNGADDVAADAALIAREIGSPVRVQWSRSDEFAWEPYGPAMMTVMRGAMDEGRIAAWEHETWTPSHLYRPRVGAELLAGRLATGAELPPRSFYAGGDRNAPTNYEIPNERVVMHWIERPPIRVSALRSLGGFANAFANESFLDELAARSGIDPVALRLSHLSDPRSREVVERAAEAAGWGRVLPPNEGLGIAFSQYENSEAYVATVAHVLVDRSSGVIRLMGMTVAHDCGLIVNPDGVRNQVEGNTIQAASRALKEAVRWDDSGITTIDWRSYPILTFSEIPEIEVILIDRPDEPPVGAGEPASVTAAPAIANAIFAATGARLREIPFTPERVKAALR